MPRSVQPDRWLFSAAMGLCLVGQLMVFSSSAVMARELYDSPYSFIGRQFVWLLLGLGGMFCLMRLDYRRLRHPAVVFTGLAVIMVLLAAVFFVDKSHATHRWIRWGGIGIQPSEFSKLVVILYLAWFLEMRRSVRDPAQSGGINDLFRSLAPALGPVMLIIGLILLQPDLGTAFEIFLVALAMLFVAGLSAKYIFYAALAAVPAVYLLIVRVPYRYNRIISFINPEVDPQGSSFQLMQSLIAVGSGGFTGVGLMESRQKLFYLPEAHTDFIYAVVCEELGFLGGVAVMALFAVFAWRGLRAAMGAPDEFGRLAALGITALVTSQALINLSVVLGLLPTKGIPLPFISYGGSSLLTMLLATGVLLNISQHAD